MRKFNVEIYYENLKGNLRAAFYEIKAASVDAARDAAITRVKSDGRRNAYRIITSRTKFAD